MVLRQNTGIEGLSKKYAEGFTFTVSKPTTDNFDFTGNKTEHLEAEISNELVRLDGDTGRIPLLKQETAVFKGEFNPANKDNPSVQLVPLNNTQRAAQLNLNPPAQTPINEWLDINGHLPDDNILEADYTASEAGILVVTVTLKGSKQYRDELAGPLKALIKQYKTNVGALDTAVTQAKTDVADEVIRLTNENAKLTVDATKEVTKSATWAEGEDVDVVALGWK